MSRGRATRDTILVTALEQTRLAGLEALSIGGLARAVGLSKSGLFAHFQSKEALQLAVLDYAAASFADEVVTPALKAPRGEPRIVALFDRWIDWSVSSEHAGGCVFVAAASEYDDRDGPVRRHIGDTLQQWISTLAKAADIAKATGHFHAELDTQQFAFELEAIFTGLHLFARLLDDERASARSRVAFEALLARARASAPAAKRR